MYVQTLKTGRRILFAHKKLQAFSAMFLILILFVPLFQPISASAAENPPSVNAHAYVVMDSHTGEFLYTKSPNKKIYPASATKLITAMVAIDNLPLTKKITMKKSVLDSVPKSSSKAGLKAGSVYTVEQLLNMLLIASGGDAAYALADAASGSQKEFVKLMNKKADDLGCDNTHFDNTVGLDIGDGYKNIYTTASDFAYITRYAMSDPLIRTIVAKKTYKIPASKNTKAISIKNTNQFYSTRSYSADLYDIIGTKTGTTNAAGYVLMTSARDSKGHEVICAFFGNKNSASTYADIRKLLDYTFTRKVDGQSILQTGFYDLWFRDSYETIQKYFENDLLSGTKDGAFSPDRSVKESELVTLLKKMSYKKASAAANDPDLTAKRLICMILGSEDEELNHQLVEKVLSYACDATVISEKFLDDPDLSLTREEMILLADYCISEEDELTTLPAEETETAS